MGKRGQAEKATWWYKKGDTRKKEELGKPKPKSLGAQLKSTSEAIKRENTVENRFRNMESKLERFSQNLEEKDKDVEIVKEKMIGIEEGKWRDGI